MTSSWRVCFELVIARNAGIEGSTERRFAFLGALLAIVLISVEVLLVSKYAHEARLLRNFDAADASGRVAKTVRAKTVAIGSGWSLGAVCGYGLSRRSLAYRLSFVAGRFGSHAPHWQAFH
jgi:hypothetical protein